VRRTRRRKAPITLALLAGLLAVGLGSSGCFLRAVRDGVDGMEQTATISGVVKVPEAWGATTVVLLREAQGRLELTAAWPSHRPGRFLFFARPGTYHVAAFQAGPDGAVPREPARWAGREGGVTLADRGREAADLVLEPGGGGDGAAHERLLQAVTRASLQALPQARHAGTVAALDEARFGEGAGKLGMWQPGLFTERHGWGVFFLRPYEPNRTPVLFVHGWGGFPQEWAALVASLDPKRFQPWILQYPSGTRLERVVDGASDVLDELKARLGFKELVVVAHSMGGLVARAAVARGPAQGWAGEVRLLVTLSTPWHGMDAAQLGLSRSPYVVPAWRDLAPDSAFVRAVHATPLPPRTASALLFGYRRGRSLLATESSDGTVALRSMLALPAQAEAEVVRGFDEDHDTILTSPDVAAELARLLALGPRSRAPRRPGRLRGPRRRRPRRSSPPRRAGRRGGAPPGSAPGSGSPAGRRSRSA